jgi:hypothetical protein
MRQRSRLAINVGNLLELLGAGCGVYGIDRLAGLSWALIATAILLIVAAELIYDAHVWRLPLPLVPQPRRWIKERRQAAQIWRRSLRARWRAGR